MSPLFAIALVAGVVGCGGDPSEGRLRGLWVNTDDEEGLHRVLEIERLDEPEGGIRHGYTIYNYGVGTPPREVQSGLFSIVDGEILWDVRSDVDRTRIGIRLASPLDDRTRRTLVIDGRTYEKTSELPGADVDPPGFGEAGFVHTGTSGTGIGLSPIPTGGVLSGQTDVALDAVTWLSPWGEAVRVRLPDGFGGLRSRTVALDGDSYGNNAPTRLARFDRVVVPGSDAQGDDLVSEIAWELPLSCQSLVALDGDWFGRCNDGVQGAIVRVDPADGSILDEQPVPSSLHGGLWALGDDLLLLRPGQSPTPQIHGEREGHVFERRSPDGTVLWSSFVPGILRVDDVAPLDGGAVLLVPTGDELTGAFVTGEQRSRLVYLDADGVVRWERDLPGPNILGGSLAAVPGGFVYGTGVMGDDFGGAVGTVGRPEQREPALLAYDACGEPYDAVAFACEGTNCNSAVDGLLVHDDSLYVQGRTMGVVTVGDEQGGSGFGFVHLVFRTGLPDAAPSCTLPEPPLPTLRVSVTGGEVEVSGLGTCSGTCDLETERFAEHEITATAGFPSVSGACTSLPCTVYADFPVVEVAVTF